MSASPISEFHNKYFVVDTFTLSSKPLTGNPAAVLFLDIPADEIKQNQQQITQTLTRLAQDLASVEVAVVLPPVKEKTDFALRFFTKTGETPNCGHATIAAARVILQHIPQYKKASELTFTIGDFDASGKKAEKPDVSIRRVQGQNSNTLELIVKPTLPTRKELTVDDKETIALAKCLNLHPSRIRDVYPHPSSKNVIVVLHSVLDVVNARTNRNSVLDFLGKDYKKLMITAAMPPSSQQQSQNNDNNTRTSVRSLEGDPVVISSSSTSSSYSQIMNQLPSVELQKRFEGKDFVSRLFAPAIGIDEDHCSAASTGILACLWALVLEEERFAGKDLLFAHQASPRGGNMTLKIDNAITVSEQQQQKITMDANRPRVHVGGDAVIVAAGKLLVAHHQSKL